MCLCVCVRVCDLSQSGYSVPLPERIFKCAFSGAFLYYIFSLSVTGEHNACRHKLQSGRIGSSPLAAHQHIFAQLDVRVKLQNVGAAESTQKRKKAATVNVSSKVKTHLTRTRPAHRSAYITMMHCSPSPATPKCFRAGKKNSFSAS